MNKRPILWTLALAAALALAAWVLRRPAEAPPPEGPPTVATATIGRRDLYRELTVQAEFRPYQEVELHAKVAGYLRSMRVDFGDRVKAGDLIAQLEVPELGDELDHAAAALERARAEARDARLDHDRLAGVAGRQPELVSQQDLDAAEARDRMAAAAVAAAQADVGRLRTLESYTRITAPFDGVVTARYADPGALIQAAASSQTQSLPLVRVSENGRLRLDFPVSVTYAGDIRAGDPVEIRIDGTARVIRAPITRFSRRITADTRTMETEVEVPNADLSLIPGMYATVVLHLENRPGALALPVQALAGTGAPSVYRIGPGGLIEDRPVELGIESPDYFEVLGGLAPGDRVVVGSRAGLQPGERVRAAGSGSS